MKKLSTLSMITASMFAALTAVGAFIKIPLPIVPFTLQVLFVFLSGALLGSKRGALSQLIYVGIGLVGVPVFTSGGGLSYIFKPTFGYLIGFIVGAFIIGFIIERIQHPKKIHFILANLAGLSAVYVFGVLYLYLSLNTWLGVPSGFGHVFMIGFVASIGGDILLSIAGGLLAERVYSTFASVRQEKKLVGGKKNELESISTRSN